ncbi:hypothetical protein [Azospirillum lipoferum]|nr:hypothetical protein [Azospirillum lipoferum]
MVAREYRFDAAALEIWRASGAPMAAVEELVIRLLQADPALTGLEVSPWKGQDQGWDLLVTAELGSTWIPAGRSGWIVGNARTYVASATMAGG